MGSHVGWSQRQRDLVEEMIKAVGEGYQNPLKIAADKVGMSYRTARNTLYKMRNRADEIRRAIQDYSTWRRRLQGRRRYL